MSTQILGPLDRGGSRSVDIQILGGGTVGWTFLEYKDSAGNLEALVRFPTGTTGADRIVLVHDDPLKMLPWSPDEPLGAAAGAPNMIMFAHGSAPDNHPRVIRFCRHAPTHLYTGAGAKPEAACRDAWSSIAYALYGVS